MSDQENSPADAGRICEITIRPDGRIYAFGICREVLDLLEALGGARDEKFRRLLEHVRRVETKEPDQQ